MNKQNYQDILDKLSKSDFRKKFHLSEKDLSYIDSKGMDTIRKHACDFIASRISPAVIKMTASKLQCVGIPSLSLSTPVHAAAVDVYINGIIFKKAEL